MWDCYWGWRYRIPRPGLVRDHNRQFLSFQGVKGESSIGKVRAIAEKNLARPADVNGVRDVLFPDGVPSELLVKP